jgi:hypothetical protein
MAFHLILGLVGAGLAVLLWSKEDFGRMPSVVSALFSGWCFFCALRRPRKNSPIVLRLGGFAWDMEDFCRGWLITGETGSGKTLAAINAVLWQVSRNCPDWGGVCVDEKGLYWETLSAMFRRLGRADDLVLLQVRPEGAPADWQPSHTFNFLEDPYLPYSAKAKMICDVASSQGQRSEQSFFRVQAQVQMEFAFRVLEAAQFAVTLENAYELVTSEKLLKEVMDLLSANESPAVKTLAEHYQSNFVAQPTEQLGGVKTTVANYLKYFTDPDIAAVFCPKKSTFRMSDIDRGKVVCVSIPQRFQVERRYVNTLLKLVFYSHVLRRFDEPADVRARHNLALCCADEAPRTLTASHDGMSDYNVVDVIRQARATFFLEGQEGEPEKSDSPKADGASKKKSEEPPPPPPPTNPKFYRIQSARGGFSILPGSVAPAVWPQRLTVSMAYDVRKGNPFGKYVEDDFRVLQGPIRVEGKEQGIRILRAEANALDLEVREPNFGFTMTGFDTRRDLIVRVREEVLSND